MKVNFLVVISLLFICCGTLVFAEQPEKLTVRSVYSDPTGAISIVVEGSELPENKSYFSLLENDKVTVTADSVVKFRDSEWKLALVLCVDASGSVAGQPLNEIKIALKGLLSKELFKPQDRIALISFINKPRRLQYFGDQQKNLEKVDHLKWVRGEEKSVLWDALYYSLEQLNQLDASPPELKRILVITDGKDEGSNKKLADVREQAMKWGISIDVVARVRKDYLKENRQEGYVSDLEELADKTGGRFAEAEEGAVNDAIELILKEVMATPVVNFSRKNLTDGKMTKRVGVRLKIPNRQVLTASIQQEIELTAIIPDPPKEEPGNPQIPSRVWGLLLALLALLAIASIVLVVLFLLKRRNEPIVPGPDPPPGIIIDPDPGEQRGRTKVGGYHFPLPEPGKPTALLIGVSGYLEGQQISIEKDSFQIGASRENDLQIAEDDYVSSKHANLRYTAGSLFIFDMASKNKTYVNQNEVTDRGFDLNIGDRIRIGMSTFKVEKAPN